MSSPHSSTVVQENIAAVVRVEKEDEHRLSPAERAAETVGSFVGTIRFILVQLGLVVVWVLVNVVPLAGIPAFDPYPFPFLFGLASLEGVLLTAFVLIRQNRMNEQADRRSHLDLQISLLSEKEVTKVIQMLQRMSQEMGIEENITDAESSELGQVTAVGNLAQELRETLDHKASAA